MPETFADGWARLAPVLQRTLDHGGFGQTAEGYLANILRGSMWAWFGRRSIMTASLVENTAEGRQAEVTAAGEAPELIQELLPRVEAWAQRQGCAQVLFWGRCGWVRLLPRLGEHGYEVTRHLYVKNLLQGRD